MLSRVAVIYNEPKHTAVEDHWLSRSLQTVHEAGAAESTFRDASEFGVLEQMESIAGALKASGHDVLIFSADDDVMRLCQFLDTEKPDIIFNCCESILGKSSLEMNVAAIYELFGIPYTGSSALSLGIALDKGVSKDIFEANGISTPHHVVIEEGETLEMLHGLSFPIIVKPVREDASIGIDEKAIVHDRAALVERIAFVHREFTQPALVEEYIEGRELNVGVLGVSHGGLTTLPISEISFDGLPEGSPRIVSYEAKWVEESPLYKLTVPKCPAVLPEGVAMAASALALKAARAIGLRDYGRVDLRMRDSDNALFVLEANPNPDISEDAGFMRASGVSGRSFADTINEILRLAIERSEIAVR
jgi:D-alanine-D-alanine ligase